MVGDAENKVIYPEEDKTLLKENEEYLKKVWKGIYYRIFSRLIFQKKDVPVIQKGMKIAFVCLGNICRSPFAELYAKKNYKVYEFFSFGFLDQEGRPSPENAIKAAEKWEIDLNLHRAKYLKEKDVQNMDIIFIFDKMNYLRYKELYKSQLSKVYYLDNKHEIPDPFKNETEYFEYIYDIISANIDRVFIKLET